MIKVAGPAGGEGVGMNPQNKKQYRRGTLQNVDHNATVFNRREAQTVSHNLTYYQYYGLLQVPAFEKAAVRQ